jgi:uncharacterized protein (DUF2147 family)
MLTLKRSFFSAILLAAAAGPVLAAPAPDPAGEWLVADGTARIRIAPCNGALWGVIAWTKEPGGVDENNPDPAKRDRPIVGLPILLNMKKAAANRWEGNVYNAENGKTYSSSISLASANVLKIQGCVFGGLFCGGEDWTRVEAAPTPATGAMQPKPAAPATAQKPATPAMPQKDAHPATAQKDVCPSL